MWEYGLKFSSSGVYSVHSVFSVNGVNSVYKSHSELDSESHRIQLFL
jgi:hypothetical protein